MIRLLIYTPVVDFEESPIKAKFIVMWTLNTKGTMKRNMCFGVSAILFFCLGIHAYAQNSVKANFGSYPADYGIAYFSMLGVSPAPTVRGLFDPNAKFATSFEGIPAVVTLEKATGTSKEFTCQLLLTLKVPEKGDMKVMRLAVTFVSDDMSEMSYCRYINLVNLVNGSKTERRSNGGQNSDGNVLGILVGVMEYCWD
jgi:hypothetical protein